MNVIEKFTSINGEGLRQGELAIFLRFAGCNLRCPYCDTLYSYIDAKWTEESVDSLVDYCVKQNIKNVTLTGGEPLLQRDIKELITKLSNNGFNVEIETNGSINIKEYLGIDNVSFTLDYKCPSYLPLEKLDIYNLE
ncbi:MAG: radical SAM protein [Gammaproteobacteria bacterium]|nr:radical SAM protein [Gammaproteobacteria bacterium]